MTSGVRLNVKRKTVLPDKYKCIFHGKTEIEKGHYFWWYPVGNVSYSRLLYELEKRYDIEVKYGIVGGLE